MKPEVVFWDILEVYSLDQWRLLAWPTNQTPLQFSSETWILDLKVDEKLEFNLPDLPKPGLTGILYVFQGSAEINKEFQLGKGEDIVFDTSSIIHVKATHGTELVLFLTDESSHHYREGMYSGNILV